MFADIEYYLPQLAHLIVHLDQNSKTKELEMLAMVICQNSIHTALQMSFIFIAYLEDYQPESSNGVHNPNCNPYFFRRAARLLQDIERAVIYGSQTLSSNEERALRRVSAGDAATLREIKKHEIASNLASSHSVENYEGQLSDMLLYKRVERKSSFHTKPWKPRYFVVDQRILFCFHEPHSVNPLRTMPLQNCEVESVSHHKYGDVCFHVHNFSSGTKFQLRATDKAMRDKWVEFLRK